MNSSFSSLILLVVLIYGLSVVVPISGDNVTDQVDTTIKLSEEDMKDCAEQYLKSKGKLDIEVPTSKKMSLCLSIIPHRLKLLREIMEKSMKKQMPNETSCVMTEFDEVDMLDRIIKFGYIMKAQPLSDDERKLRVDAMLNETEGLVKRIADTCKVDVEEIKSSMFDGLDCLPSGDAAETQAPTENLAAVVTSS